MCPDFHVKNKFSVWSTRIFHTVLLRERVGKEGRQREGGREREGVREREGDKESLREGERKRD